MAKKKEKTETEVILTQISDELSQMDPTSTEYQNLAKTYNDILETQTKIQENTSNDKRSKLEAVTKIGVCVAGLVGGAAATLWRVGQEKALLTSLEVAENLGKMPCPTRKKLTEIMLKGFSAKF